MKHLFFLLLFFLKLSIAFCQNKSSDSLINRLLSEQATPGNDQGLQLIESGNYAGASQFLTNEISKDESDRKAYFRRGVANWALSDTLSACRDWSAVLALGDTEMFNLLESKCHGAMIIEEDTIPSRQYRKMWAKQNHAAEAEQENARTVVEVMPSYPGGEQKMFEYLVQNLKRPANAVRGTVYVNFLIDKKGKILFPYVTRGLNSECNKEALRLIRSMPAWNPGKEKGKAVYVRSNLPIRF
jgi:hypothetical protein